MQSVGTLRAVLLLVHSSDAPPDDSVAAPDGLLEATGGWFRAVSYGRLELRVVDVLARRPGGAYRIRVTAR